MATKEQIARAKARVALARLSGKSLPAHVIERAALTYAEAEVEPSAEEPSVAAGSQTDAVVEPEKQPSEHFADWVLEHDVTRKRVQVDGRYIEPRTARSGRWTYRQIGSGIFASGNYRDGRIIQHDGGASRQTLPEIPPLVPGVLDLREHALLTKHLDGMATAVVESFPNWLTDAASRFGDTVVRAGENVSRTLWRNPVDGVVVIEDKVQSTQPSEATAAVDALVRGTHKGMHPPVEGRLALPVDEGTREYLAKRVADDIVAMEPRYAKMIADAVYEALDNEHVIEAAEDARLA